MESTRVGIFKGLAFWLLSTVVFKLMLNTLLATTAFIIYSIRGIRKGSWLVFSEGMGTILFRAALTYDHTANVWGEPALNGVFLEYKFKSFAGHRVSYGHQDDTISDITGRNVMIANLTNHGKRFQHVLNRVLGDRHCVESVPREVKKRLLGDA